MPACKLEVNVPQVVALTFSEGKPVESQFTGEQIMFTLTDGRQLYVPPLVAEKIRAAGIVARVPFEICKRQVGRQIEYQVKHHNTAGEVSEAKPAARVQSIERTVPKSYTAPLPDRCYAHSDAALVGRAAALDGAKQPERPAVSPMAARILASYVVAFEVVGALAEVVNERGLALNFTREEHIRTIAATAFIEANKNGGAR
jgi:hypothetical protein